MALSIDLIERTKRDVEPQAEATKIIENNDPLKLIEPSNRIAIQPIWQKGNDLEGRLYREYIKCHPEYAGIYLRESVCRRLVTAAANLPADWRIVVAAGHRPASVQKRLYEIFFKKIKSENPQLSDEDAGRQTRYYVSDPSRKVSPHCSGAAVDIFANSQSNDRLIDFGSKVNDETERSFIHSSKINEKQYANRLVLLEAMLGAGFASLQSEWWHFSYGDQNWAAFYNKPNAIYGAREV